MSARRSATLAKDDAVLSPLPLDAGLWKAVAGELSLSPQQTRIVELILRGQKDKEIANALNLTVPTIRTYLSRIFTKLKVDDRIALVLRVFSVSQRLAASRSGHQS